MGIPAYLKDLSKRRLDFGGYPDADASLVDLVLQDLARFVKALYGDEEGVLLAGRAVVRDDAAGRTAALADLLGHFIDKGRLEIRAAGPSRRKPAMLEFQHEEHAGLLFPHATPEKLAAPSSAPMPSIDHLYRVLEEAGILLDGHDDGPVVRREWFDERRRLSRATRSGLLKVHG